MSLSREQLIEIVNERTAGNRADYLTRADVEQIVDEVLAQQGVEVVETDPVPSDDPPA